MVGFYAARKPYGKKSSFSPEVVLARRLGRLPKRQGLGDIDIGVRLGSLEALEYRGMESDPSATSRLRISSPEADILHTPGSRLLRPLKPAFSSFRRV
jgi:hypothetical protein